MCAGAASAFIGVGELEADVERASSVPQGPLILEVDNAKLHSDDQWVALDTGVSGAQSDSARSSSFVQSAAIPDKNPSPDASETAVETQDEPAFTERRDLMFDISATGPVGSGLEPVAGTANKRILQNASAVLKLDKLTAEMVKALSAAHGNFDRIVALGWLIADAVQAVGSPMMERNKAYAVGMKAGREALKIKTDLATLRRDAMRDVSRLDNENPTHGALRDTRFKQLASAQTDLLDSPVELSLSAQAAPAVSTATGSRKRALDPVPQEDTLVADAKAELDQKIKDVEPARRAKEDAAGKETSKMRVLQRVTKLKLKKGAKVEAVMDHLSLLNRACKEHLQAQLAAKQAQLVHMAALLVVSRAEKKYLKCYYPAQMLVMSREIISEMAPD
jgi:hypothetical protein